MRKLYIFLLFTITSILGVYSQSLENNIENKLKEYFAGYVTNANIGKCKLSSYDINHDKRTLRIYPNENFGYQSFTPEKVETIYSTIKSLLPGPANYYEITVVADGKPIEDLVPNIFLRHRDKTRELGKLEYKGKQWVKNISNEVYPTKGLNGRHIAIWQSHGKYFDASQNRWIWQRPNLFATNEDMFTQSFVTQFIIPMIENAGATVFTPRERDWQRNEVIVDNDGGGTYLETSSKKGKWMTHIQKGFAQKYQKYLDNHNPFEDGTVRFTVTEKKAEKAFAQWIPNIPESGEYAVYVTYQSLPESIDDAKYMVFHKGGVTEFHVNQQMGEGTWVYLGTFAFDKGSNDYGMVVLSNQSKSKGVVCADAVRFGGGMGNIVRRGKTSGLPRYLEGARYSAQWYGMPYNVYSPSKGEDDYKDDINVRGNATNYISGKSIYNPIYSGLAVPLDLSLGLHSDAGYSRGDSLIGSLGIYTTDTNKKLLNSGISRYASRDFADLMLNGIKRDILSQFNINWKVRSLWNRNYSETRVPGIPSMILELLSHQNFADMQLGHDPRFKFTVGRSVYKSILKYISSMHNEDYIVQPLPVTEFMITEDKKNRFTLSWRETIDKDEPTAKPVAYKVYTRVGYGGFDNGVLVEGNKYTFKAEPGLTYSFKVTAVNKGGESFPSEILSAYKARKSLGTILIVNGFDRLSGPAFTNDSLSQGFDLSEDAGMPYIRTSSFCGNQIVNDKSKIGIENSNGLGYSGNELEGVIVAGNTFDYPFVHGKAIQRDGRYSYVSCSSAALVKSGQNLDKYFAIDYIYGAQKSPLSRDIQALLTIYCNRGGNLIISGTDIVSGADNYSANFNKEILKCDNGGSMHTINSGNISGIGLNFTIPVTLNEKVYCAEASDCVMPLSTAFSTFVYTPGNYSAATAYKGDYRTFVLGFPFECVDGENNRAAIMSAAINFFMSK